MAILTNSEVLKLMVRGAYDLQDLRIRVGLRLVANFKSKLTDQPTVDENVDEMSEEAKKIINQLKASYKRLTDGIARNRTLPDQKKFTGDELISTFAELTLVDQYIQLEKQEATHFRQMQAILDKIPIYTEYLSKQTGIGPAMAGVLLTYLDPHKAPRVSSFWKYCGLDVAEDGAGRSRRKEHLVEREYTNKAGELATRMSVTYNPFAKTKIVSVLGSNFLRNSSPWREAYDNRKHKMETNPNLQRIDVGKWKKIYKERKKERGDEMSVGDMRDYWPPGRIHADANRYMIKMFLADFWAIWREMEGLPVTPTYHEAKLGHTHGRSRLDTRDQSAA